MSKTDKTDPYYVKLHRYGVEEHDHSNGICDYDPNETAHDPGCWVTRWKYKKCGKAQSNASYFNNDWFAQAKCVREESKRQNRAERRKVKAAIHHERYDELVKYGTGRNDAVWVCY